MKKIFTTLFQSNFFYSVSIYYLFIFLWWAYIQGVQVEKTYIYFFNWSYGLIALSGGVYGIWLSIKKWGGFGSMIGKCIIFLSIGMLGQWLGLQVWTYYNVLLKVEVPYPSLADFGYFTLVPSYAYAACLLAQASGGRVALRTAVGKLTIIILPLTALVIAYYLFVKNIGIDMTNPLKMFFDFAYPLGEIIPGTIALYIFSLSKSILGGNMRRRVLLLAFGFLFQFITEYTFLYQAGVGTYVNGGYVDFMYATSYFMMTSVIVLYSKHLD